MSAETIVILSAIIGALHGRLKRGWDINRALTEKPNKQYAIRSRTPADIEAARKERT